MNFNTIKKKLSLNSEGILMSETEELISRLESFPQKLRTVVEPLSPDQLQLKIINWSIVTAVHHICDSHLNSYIRIKMALTESTPTIKPYNESAWSTLADVSLPIDSSLSILDGIHLRICSILKSLTSSDWQKSFIHPELSLSSITLLDYCKNFANHGENHLKAIQTTLTKNNIN